MSVQIKTSRSALFLASALLLSGMVPASAGTWVCGEGCDPATFKGVKWIGGDKCAKPKPPVLNVKTPKGYNDSVNATNEFTNAGNAFLSCMNEEVQADFSAAQQNLLDSAKASFEVPQTEFKAVHEGLAQQLDEGIKKLSKGK